MSKSNLDTGNPSKISIDGGKGSQTSGVQQQHGQASGETGIRGFPQPSPFDQVVDEEPSQEPAQPTGGEPRVEVPDSLVSRSERSTESTQADGLQSAASLVTGQSMADDASKAAGYSPAVREEDPGDAPMQSLLMQEDPSPTAPLADNSLDDMPPNAPAAPTGVTPEKPARDDDAEPANDEDEDVPEYVKAIREMRKNVPSPEELTVQDPNVRLDNSFDGVAGSKARIAVEEETKAATNSLGREYLVGNNMSGILTSDPTIEPDAFSLGDEILLAALRQPTSNVAEFLAEKTGLDPVMLKDLGVSEDPFTLEDLIKTVNGMDIPVYTEKHPTVGTADNVVRYLRIHHGDIIRLHPLAAKMYNADYDGDVMVVKFNDGLIKGLPYAMDRMIDSLGNLSIDPDFFLVMQATEEQFEAWIAPDLEDMGVSRKDISYICSDLEAVTMSGNREAAYTALMRDMREAARNSSPGRGVNKQTSRILKSVYDNCGDALRFTVEDQSITNEYVRPAIPEYSENEADRTLADWMEGLQSRTIPLNFQEFKAFFANSLHVHEGQNLDFRISANIGKLIKLNDFMRIGEKETSIRFDNDETLWKLYSASVDYIYTKMMNNRFSSGQEEFRSSWLTIHVVKEAGVPSNYLKSNGKIDWNFFWKRFDKAYEKYASMMDYAKTEIRRDWSIGKRTAHQIGGVNRRETGKSLDQSRRFSRVYKDFRLSTLFGHDENFVNHTTPGVRDMSVSTFISRGGSIGTIKTRDEEGKLVPVGKYDRPINNSYEMLIGLADIRRKSAVEFDHQFEKTATVAVKRMRELRKILREWDTMKRDYSGFIDIVTQDMMLMSKDVFLYYELDTADAWINTRIGRELVNCKTVDQLQNKIMKMTVDYRIRRVRSKAKTYHEALDNPAEVAPDVSEQLADYMTEVSALRSSSPAMALISSDADAHGTIFKDYKERLSEQVANPQAGWNMIINYKKWESLEAKSFLDVMRDDSITWKDKKDILTDAIKLFTGGRYTNNEVAWMLQQDPMNIFAGNRFTNADGYSQAIEDMKESQRKMDKDTMQSISEALGDVDSALKADDAVTCVERMLNDIRDDPSALLVVDEELYADAVISFMDKENKDTEKSSQQDCVNAIFTALSLQRSGGLFSDLALTDDIMSGRISKSKLLECPTMVAFILANPDVSLTVYDENGVFPLSRDTMCGKIDSTAEDVTKFLRDHPRVALSMRKHTAVPGKDGSCFIAAMETFSDAMERQRNGKRARKTGKTKYSAAFGAVADKPGFGAVLCAMSRTTGVTSRKKRSQVRADINVLLDDLMKLANMDPITAHNTVQKIDFGKMPTDMFGDEIELDTWYDEERREYLNDIDALRYHLQDMIEDASRAIRSLPQNMRQVTGKPKFDYFRLDDIQTVYSVMDAEQMLSGAKTSVMTGVNGSETRNNGLFAYYASYKPKPPEKDAPAKTVAVSDILKDMDRYEGWHIADGGYITPEYILALPSDVESLELYDPAECTCVGHCCENHSVADASLDNRTARQYTAASLFMVCQRMDSTEKNGLKAKKTGIDDKNSITKFSVFDALKWRGNMKMLDRWSESARPTIDQAYKSGGLVAARREYAKRLREQQRSLGYDDLTLSQYENIASMLLFEKVIDESNKKLSICSMEQISYVIHYGSDLESLYECDNVDELREVLDSAMLAYDPGNQTDIEDVLIGVKVAFKMNARPTVRTRSSSFERNLLCINNLVRRLESRGIDVPFLTKEERRDISTKNATRHKAILSAFPYAFDIKRKFNRDTKSFEYKTGSYIIKNHYDVLGVLTEGTKASDMVLNAPSPTNLWVIDEKADPLEVKKVINTAKAWGVTVAMTSKAKDAFVGVMDLRTAENVCEAKNGTFVIPFFDMALNGWDEPGYNPSTMNVGISRIDPSRVTRMVESTQGEFQEGDASGVSTDSFNKRSMAFMDGVWELSTDRMFAATLYREYGDGGRGEVWYDKGPVEIVPYAEAGALFANISDVEDLPTIDLGVRPGHPGYEEAYSNFITRLVRYQKAYRQQSATTEYQWKDCRPGDIVGWVRMNPINPETGIREPIYAPIMPFQQLEGKASPRYYDASMQINESTGAVQVYWTHESNLVNKVFKFFEGRNSANKMIVDGGRSIGDRPLRSGNLIDIFISASTTKSRRLSNLRIDTMYTLAMESRLEPHGYNIAEHKWCLVNDPLKTDDNPGGLKEMILNGTTTASVWREVLKEPVEFVSSTEPDAAELNAFLNKQCKKALAIGVDPSIWLASRFGGRPHNIGFRYDAMFQNSTTYQDMYQKWLAKMDPSICPYGVNGDSSKTLFRNKPEDHSLQVLVPYYRPDGSRYEVWEHMFTGYGFVDQHYSGGMRPSIQGKMYSAPGLITMGYGGKRIGGRKLRDVIRWSMADRTLMAASRNSMYIDQDSNSSAEDEDDDETESE